MSVRRSSPESLSIGFASGCIRRPDCWRALASLIYVARFDTAKADVGKGFELDVITAVVLGGTSIYGGRGSILGTTLGLLLIHETRLFVSRYWGSDEFRSIVIGSLLIVAVLACQLVLRKHPDLLPET